jgi:hypothetical protein
MDRKALEKEYKNYSNPQLTNAYRSVKSAHNEYGKSKDSMSRDKFLRSGLLAHGQELSIRLVVLERMMEERNIDIPKD